MNKSIMIIISLISFATLFIIAAIAIIYVLESPAQQREYCLKIESIDLTGSDLDDNTGYEEVVYYLTIEDIIYSSKSFRGVNVIDIQEEHLFYAKPNQPFTLKMTVEEKDYLDPNDIASGTFYNSNFTESRLNTIIILKDQNDRPVKVAVKCWEVRKR